MLLPLLRAYSPAALSYILTCCLSYVLTCYLSFAHTHPLHSLIYSPAALSYLFALLSYLCIPHTHTLYSSGHHTQDRRRDPGSGHYAALKPSAITLHSSQRPLRCTQAIDHYAALKPSAITLHSNHHIYSHGHHTRDRRRDPWSGHDTRACRRPARRGVEGAGRGGGRTAD